MAALVSDVTSQLPHSGTNMKNSSPVAATKGRDSHVYGFCGNQPTVQLLELQGQSMYPPLNRETHWVFSPLLLCRFFPLYKIYQIHTDATQFDGTVEQ